MAKTINPKDNRANQQNANKGTKGTYAKVNGNKGKQQNPNQRDNK